MGLLNRRALEASPVVANCDMNRERRLAGYVKELGVDPLAILRSQAEAQGRAAWLGLCCGTGRALIDAAKEIQSDPLSDRITIEGVDLAGVFDPNPFANTLTLRRQTIEAWAPTRQYALATCVHGLHYVGDKLAAIAKIVSSLAPHGLFVANFDLAGFKFEDARPAGRTITAWLRKNQLQYNPRRRLLHCEGPRRLEIPLKYIGADDQVGPNYTGQAAVASYYEDLG